MDHSGSMEFDEFLQMCSALHKFRRLSSRAAVVVVVLVVVGVVVIFVVVGVVVIFVVVVVQVGSRQLQRLT